MKTRDYLCLKQENIKLRESMMHLFDQASQKISDDLTVPSSDCPMMHQRNIVLEQVCQSLESESGLVKCIQNVIAFHPGCGSRATESIHSHENGSKGASRSRSACTGLQNAAKTSIGMSFSGSADEPDHSTVTELCASTFSDIIISQKFTQLCCLLLENFQGIKANKLFDLSHINSRMKDGAYESSPLLFHSDFQQIWTKLLKVGTDITTLAKRLSDKTTMSFQEQVDSSARSISANGRHEFVTQESDIHTKREPVEASAPGEEHTCRHCIEKINERNRLVCDLCEEIYHIFCIEPPVQEIPTESWFCANCSAKGIGFPLGKLEESSKEARKRFPKCKKQVKETGAGIRCKRKAKFYEENVQRESKGLAFDGKL